MSKEKSKEKNIFKYFSLNEKRIAKFLIENIEEIPFLIQRELPTCKGGDESKFLYLPFVL